MCTGWANGGSREEDVLHLCDGGLANGTAIVAGVLDASCAGLAAATVAARAKHAVAGVVHARDAAIRVCVFLAPGL